MMRATCMLIYLSIAWLTLGVAVPSAGMMYHSSWPNLLAPDRAVAAGAAVLQRLTNRTSPDIIFAASCLWCFRFPDAIEFQRRLRLGPIEQLKPGAVCSGALILTIQPTCVSAWLLRRPCTGWVRTPLQLCSLTPMSKTVVLDLTDCHGQRDERKLYLTKLGMLPSCGRICF